MQRDPRSAFSKGVAGRGGKGVSRVCPIQGERHGDGPRAATSSELCPATRLPASRLSQALVLHCSTFGCDLRRSRNTQTVLSLFLRICSATTIHQSSPGHSARQIEYPSKHIPLSHATFLVGSVDPPESPLGRVEGGWWTDHSGRWAFFQDYHIASVSSLGKRPSVLGLGQQSVGVSGCCRRQAQTSLWD